MLEVVKLEKSFKKKKVLVDINYLFKPAVYGLLGPNGSGKTTLMRCLTNLYEYKGQVTYAGKNIIDNNSYISRLGYLPQKFDLFKELSVREMMTYFAALKEIDSGKQKKAVEDSVALLNLSDRIDTKVRTLSGGMVRRLGIAQAILNDPEVLIVDEPTSGLDPEERMRFKNLISTIGKNRIIIISTHIVEDVEAVCDQIVILHEGRILTSGDCGAIQGIARDKVYEVSEEEKSLLQGEHYLAKRLERNGTVLFRVLTREKQPLAPATPTIEDGYIWALKWL